jgi:DtxR family Mn-dependent transcriptional regulator
MTVSENLRKGNAAPREAHMDKELSSKLEDYLEAIFRLEKKKRAARVRDIAQQVGVSKSTVSAALKSLASKNLIEYEPYELIMLTSKGRDKAAALVMNHYIISHFLQSVLALGRQRAERIACEFEHAVDQEVMDRFVCFLAFAEKFSRDGANLLDEFKQFLNEGSEDRICKELCRVYRRRIEAEMDSR